MFKNKNKNENEITKISNIFFIVMGVLSLLSIFSLLSNGVDGIEGYSKGDYYFNLIMMIIYTLVSALILLLTNRKNILYKDEYPISRRTFNLFVMISIMSMIVTISANTLNYFIYKNFSWHSIIITIIGYIPAYIIAYKEVSKGQLLNTDNEPKINVANFLIVYLLMQYYINVVSILTQIILNTEDIAPLLGALCWALIWICIVIIAYKLINKKETFNQTLNKRNK